MDIKEVLKSGSLTEADLIAQLQEQIREAKNEIQKEKQAEAERAAREAEAKRKQECKTHMLDDCRATMIDAIVNYLDVAGMLDAKKIKDTDLAELNKYIKDQEDAYFSVQRDIEKLSALLDEKFVKQDRSEKAAKASKESSMNEDEVLAKFLAGIGL